MYVSAEATLWRSQTEETEMSRYNPRVAATRSQARPAPASVPAAATNHGQSQAHACGLSRPVCRGMPGQQCQGHRLSEPAGG